MANNSNKTYWPHMIVGFLMTAITLGYWTVRSASSMPVQESNRYMQKYQMVDIDINDILEKKEAFDKKFTIKLIDKERMVVTDNIYSNRVQENQIILNSGSNNFDFIIESKNSSNSIKASNIKSIQFLLTRPHTKVDDILVKDIKIENSKISIKDINIEKKGRYTIQIRIDMKDGSMGYYQTPAYLK
ncbi:FIG00545237: hypothetical protein [hydrothermal vent metagenome]|uniref:YtkA-like domain-containing protein n=1 Tax=hydrothermal vent metagenome TaxID=652676 RepID=A0A1W1EHC6_9ZZZZ